jgi:hypothetical protein
MEFMGTTPSALLFQRLPSLSSFLALSNSHMLDINLISNHFLPNKMKNPPFTSTNFIMRRGCGLALDIKPLKSNMRRSRWESGELQAVDPRPRHGLFHSLGKRVSVNRRSNHQMMTKAFAESNCLNPYD